MRQKCWVDCDKRGVRRQIKLLSGILPKPLVDEKAERLYKRQMKLTAAVDVTGGVAIFVGAAGMELSDALFPDNDVLFMICFCAAMLGVLTILVLLPNILSIRRRLIEYYFADYTPVCAQLDEHTREMCGKALLFFSV